VFFEKVPLKKGTDLYLIDHTSFVYVLDAEASYKGYFPPGTSGRRMAEQVRALCRRLHHDNGRSHGDLSSRTAAFDPDPHPSIGP
jgi:hypothetical protein